MYFTIHCQTSDHYKELSRTWEAESRSAVKAFKGFNNKITGGSCWTVS